MDLELKPILNTQASLDGIKLTPEDAFVLSRINGTSSIAEIQMIVGFPQDKVVEIFNKLVDCKLVLLEQKQDKQERTRHDKVITNTIQKRIRDKYELVEKKKHYEVLEIGKGSSDEIIEKAYYKMSKEFHPDRFFKEPLGPFKKMLEEVFHGIQLAHEILSDPTLKKKYFQEQRKRTVATVAFDDKDEPTVGRSLEHVTYDMSSAQSQYEMGLKEEERGNLKAALNFFKMAIVFDGDKRSYKEAYDRVQKTMKANPLKGGTVDL